MAKTGEAEPVELDVAASVARSMTGKAGSSLPEALAFPQDVDMVLEARLTAQFSALEAIEDEQQLVSAFLTASRASQRLLTLKLLANPAIERFPELLQFFLRVMMAVHARSHAQQTVKGLLEPSTCSYAQNTAQSCISFEQEDNSGASVAFQLPEGFHSCLATHFGSVKRLKCEEVWHGDHMAYRCRTCGLSDSSCMCLACFDPEEHEGHDYRVYRCSSGGCCDCGDPLAWKPEGFCKKHSAKKENKQREEMQDKMEMDPEENEVVQMLVRRTMDFCVDVLREVHLACLRPHASENPDPFHPRRSLPRTGLQRSAFPSVVKVHVDRLQQSLAWLQMLSMSCLYYRNMISDMFFEELPADFQLTTGSTQNTTASDSSSQPVEDNPLEAVPTSRGSEEEEAEEQAITHGPLLMLDVFLKAGVLLPVEACDVLGVLYLKLLFDQAFKQKYTCHFVEWYPYFIELYLSASDENNEDGMRNLSRFIDRLFCQLFHSNAQLRELETVFASLRPTFNPNEAHGTRRRRRRRPHDAPGSPTVATDSTPSSCVEWLMVFLLEKLNDLFRSTLRLMTILPQPLLDGTRVGASANGNSTSTVGIGTVPEAPPVLRTVQAVDCGRNVFKKRIYARLCSDLRTLLVHPQIAAEVLLRSFRCIGGNDCELHGSSVYAQLMKTFELLQQMDLQTRHVHRHIEYESQNWTFAFVADYELKLLLSAFLTGIPACFSREVWGNITTGENSWNQGAMGVITGSTPLNPLESDTFRPLALARALLQPVRASLGQWATRNGRPELVSEATESASAGPGEGAMKSAKVMNTQLVKYYEQGTVALGGASAKSFHFPLHHMYAALIHALCGVVRPQTMDNWRELLGMGITDEEKGKDLSFWYGVLDHPLRVLLFSREIKAGLWVRNGGVMLQQLIHYHSKHWRYFGLHSDLFLCQLGASLLPHGSFTRLFFHQLPFGICDSTVLGINSPGVEIDSNSVVADGDRSRELRQELDIVEEALRLLLQLVLAPVKLASASSPETSAVWLLEREIMHWLTLGPFTRSEVILRTDMKLVEQIKQLPAHEWAELEEEEILTHVLENVGVYDDPVGTSSGPRAARSGSFVGYGLKMSGSWKLKPELWSRVSPLFECFTPSEAQQCEQNIRKNPSKPNGEEVASTSPIILPMLPQPQLEGKSGVDMHGLLVETMLNSSYMASVLFVIFENYKRKVMVQHPAPPGAGEQQDRADSATNENLLLAALHCLYVAVEMLPKDVQDLQPQAQRNSDGMGSNQNLDDIAQCFDEESTLFVKLCTEVPVEAQAHESEGHEMVGSSLLSLLLFFTDHKSAMEDSEPVVELILQSVCEKSSACSQYLGAIKRRKLESRSNVESCSNPVSCSKDDSDETSDDRPKLTAKEMMRRRQQQILEKMRSQQMQFLSANGDDMEDDAVGNSRNGIEGQDMAESDSDSYDESMESEEGLDHEEDEWGFPTGQVDVRLYLDHLSSAIAQIREKQRRSQDRRRRRRRSTRSSSITAENDERERSSSISCDFGSLDETEECGLCRLPCDPRSRESSFGFVGMILPTNMPQKIEKCSLTGANSDARPAVSSRLPSLRVLKPGTTDEMRMQLADSVIWSCGHAIHHACLKAYLMSLWKQKHGRSPLEMASGEDRLLSERDMEFVCPICRRLSNCLVPRVSLGEIRERSSAGEFTKSGFGSDEEEEEKKDDGQDPLAFLQWLDTHMSFRDDSPVVKRRRSRTQSSLRLRRRLLSSASKTSLSPGSRSSASSPLSPAEQDSAEQDVSVEREIGAFCHEIVLRSVRAQLYLPTLLTSSIRDDGSLDLEMQQLSSECGAQTPAWQLLLHCLEVQLRVVARAKTLLQTDVVDPLQLRSMRQIADITAAAVAFSTPSSLAWTVVEAPADKQFESVMTRLNGLIFGQQVLFEEDEESSSSKWSMPPMGDIDDATDAALVGTPMLCHPRLLTCFAMRLMWRQSIATPNSDVAVEQLLTEAFFSARVLFTAQILQAVAYLSMQDHQDKAASGEEPVDKPKVEIRDFEQVESLRDASAWISLMLARSRLTDTKAFTVSDVKPARKWNAAAMEEQVSALCLPLAQQMLLLMDIVLQLPHHHSDSQGDDSKTPQAASESCAVCDGLFLATSPSTGTPTASALLEKCLRRLHLPPLRLFFHRQMFPSSQRALCQLWGAQLEAKAAVSRQQARSQALVAGGSPTEVDAFPLQRQVRLLSSRAAAVASAGADFRLLIELPRVYMDLFIRYNEKPTGVCGQCAQVPQHPGLCLFCGEVLCCFSACCEAKKGGGVGECTQHAQRCGLGIGAFLLLRACTVILFLGNERRCVWGSLYVDKNGEEDPYLRRGKTLYLDESRRLALETLLVSHSFSQNTAILQNTSRRDGRRY